MKRKIINSEQDAMIAELTAKNLKKNRGELYHVRQMNIPKIVAKYLHLGTVTYAQRVNSYDALESLGYGFPKYDGQAKAEFVGKAIRFSVLLQETLVELGFKADRTSRNYNVKNTDTKHDKKVTVYTNLPSTVYYKAMKSIAHAEDSMNLDHTRSIEMDQFEKKFPVHYRNGEVFLADTHQAGKKLIKINNTPKESFVAFAEEYEPDEEKVFEYFKDRTTKKYRRFLKEED